MTMTETERALPPATPASPAVDRRPRSVAEALMRGGHCRCPACGTGALFERYLKVTPFCGHCGEALYHQRADDAPPYMVILVVGHIVVPLLVLVEEVFRPPVWGHLALWLPLTLVLSLVLLPPVKAMLVNLQWALRMHGFDPASPEREAPPPGAPSPASVSRTAMP
ncbi:DUF983 domain-containing protein [Xanthobacter sp. ZOL 2024]